MTGSSLAPVVIPIVVVILLAMWLFMVYYADSHPEPGVKSRTPGPGRSGPAALADWRPPVPRRPDESEHRVPAGHASRTLSGHA